MHLAALVATSAACGGSTTTSSGTSDAGTPPGPGVTGVDGGSDTPGTRACGTLADGGENVTTVELTSAAACTAFSSGTRNGPSVFQCNACPASHSVCVFPEGVAIALAEDGGADGGAACPEVPEPVTVQCYVDCTGRRTDGIGDATIVSGSEAGEYFAWCAHLEAVSVHAFQRLARELRHHGAPGELVALSERAADEEVRHTQAMERLAVRYGGVMRTLEASEAPARSLFEVALENAVEGCVRETFGAALGLVRAARSSDAEVRNALALIAIDECDHAETSWSVLRWTTSQLSLGERAAIARAMEEALEALAEDVRIEDPLTRHARAVAGMPTRAEKGMLLRLVTTEIVLPAAA